MIQVAVDNFIRAPRQEVFEAVADPFRQVEWDGSYMSGVQQLTPGPIREGSRFTCRLRGLGRMDYRFTTYQPWDRFHHASEMFVMTGEHEFIFDEEAGGTRFRQVMSVRPKGLGFLLYPFLKKMLRRRLLQMNRELKEWMEKERAH
jgi:hypothetical protein